MSRLPISGEALNSGWRRLSVAVALTISALATAGETGETATVGGAGVKHSDATATAEQEHFFETEVRPLLLAACTECHGAGRAESGLRLDRGEGFLAGGDSGPPIDHEHPDDSLLLEVIGYEDAIQMPPAGKLTAVQIEVFRKWVEMGAPWPAEAATTADNPLGLRSGPITDQEREHWSFQPLAAAIEVPESPPVGHPWRDWAETDIDRFVLAGQLTRGLTPVGDADRLRWLRRLTFDLTGLPPTPTELQDFIDDTEADAHVRAIDRLLESPHYGERWGRHWLDLVRYADTAGDGADYPIREAYRYRDYVIAAFNSDKPYDRFVREQIAGDILAQAAAEAGVATAERFAEQVTATGYLAMTKRFGYNINTQFQHLDIADTIDNLGHVFLGLSVGCARCHDHKYDAITAEDYYALYGILASSRYSFPGGEEYKRPHDLIPLALPAEVAAAEAKVAQELAELDERLAEVGDRREALIDGLRHGVSRDPGWELQTLGKPGGTPWFTAGPQTIVAEAQSPFKHVYPIGTQGVRISHGKPTDGIRQEFPDVTTAQSPTFHFNVDFRNVAAVEGRGAYRFYLGRGAIQSLAIECSIDSRQFSIRDGDRFVVLRELEPGVWYNLRLDIDMAAQTFSGHVGRPGDVVSFADLKAAPGWDGVLNTFVCDGFGQDQSVSPQRDIDNVIGQLTPLPAMPNADADAIGSVEDVEAAAEVAEVRRQLAELAETAERLTGQRQAAESRIRFPMAYGVSEGTPANARLQRRGEPDRLGDEVPRRFLDVLGGDRVPEDSDGSGRLELADWLTRPENPLTARVWVNRVWQRLFGRGLVATPNDFGTRGELPSHPELLDFLTAEFIADGWSTKRLQRRILTSRVYRLASVETEEHRLVDPENRWLARHQRRPLDAESIRDAMLAVSGQLDRSPGGAHPFPDVESWQFTIHYPFHAVYDSNHRSVYLMIQRARRHPYLSLFDAADPNISTATRQATITPTQSLYLMNAPFVHAQAAGFAQRLLAGRNATAGAVAAGSAVTADSAAAIRWAFLQAFAREPTSDEVATASEFLSEAETVLRSAGDADSARAGWEAFCRVLLTSNEFLYLD